MVLPGACRFIRLKINVSPFNRTALLCFFFITWSNSSQAQLEPISQGLYRLTGADSGTEIQYTRLYLEGRLVQADRQAIVSQPSPPPQLIVQCTSVAFNKYEVELFANFGDVVDTSFYAPWRPTKLRPNRPPVKEVPIVMHFFGYTEVKPMKRNWDMLEMPAGQFRYNSPGMHSSIWRPRASISASCDHCLPCSLR